MKRTILIIAIIVTTILASESFAQSKKRKTIIKEKSARPEIYDIFGSESNDLMHSYTTSITEFYIDTTKSRINKALYNFLIKNPIKSTKLERNTYFNEFAGERIDTIIILNGGIFDKEHPKKFINAIQQMADWTHSKTRPGIIGRLLTFKVGEMLSPEQMIISESIITNNEFIANANIIIEKNEHGGVDVYVVTKDTWSISADVAFNYKYDSHISLIENNFLGIGHNLIYTQYFNREEKKYFKGFDLGYEAKNIYARYLDAKVIGGYGTDYHKINVAINREFILKGDFAGGVEYNYGRVNEDLLLIDTFINLKRELMSGWAGKSFKINRHNSAFYITAQYYRQRYSDVPIVITEDFNTKFHNYDQIIGAIGIYKESFYRSNLIYGYGYTEQVPYGYRAEIIGGYKWGQYYNTPYIGTSISYGHNIPIGYISGNFDFGTYINSNKGELERTIYSFKLNYFTNLIKASELFSLRAFLNASYITGVNMLRGEGNSVIFSYKEKPHYERERAVGKTRMLIKPETVVFTPYEILGFKLVGFSFLNIGTIGNSANPFNNKFFCEMGLGVRLKNDNFIFKNIEIKFVIGLVNPPGYTNSIYSVSSEPRLYLNGYTPTSPTVVPYR